MFFIATFSISFSFLFISLYFYIMNASPPIHHHHLLLPEIAQSLSSYLNNKALYRCILVSRHWYHVFLPSLWHMVTLTQSDSLSPEAFASIAQHASLVHVLKLKKPTDDCCIRLLRTHWPRLHSVDLDVNSLTELELMNIHQGFMERHGPLLRSLRYRIYTRCAPRDQRYNLRHILSGCQRYNRLSTLHLQGVLIDLDSLTEDVRYILNDLTSLSLDGVLQYHLDESNQTKEENTTPTSTWQLGRGKICRIQELIIRSAYITGIHDEYPLILDCQDLRSLVWRPPHRTFNGCPIAEDLRKGGWPHLSSLHFSRTRLEDEYLSDIILAMGHRPLKELHVEGTRFGEKSAKALLWRGRSEATLDDRVRQCREALEGLFVAESRDTGTMVLQFLCNFPNLKRFSGSMLTADELLGDPRPWVCKELKVLRLPLALQYMETERTIPIASVFIERLSLLTRLEELCVLDHWESERRELQALELGLQLNMESLKTLTRLREVNWGAYNYQVTLEDVQWMVMHWPALEVVSVTMTNCVEPLAAQLLQDHDIRLTDIK